MFKTIDEIAEKVLSTLPENEKIYLRSLSESDMIYFHDIMGRSIRNEYKLWNGSPLTKAWFEDQKNNTNTYIVDGVDHHPCHPDAVSMNILNLIWRKNL